MTTGKELDPDFVDANSVNRRYHYPLRSYAPFRAAFLQQDPLPAKRRGAGLPIYHLQAPTLRADPSGAVEVVVTKLKETKLECGGYEVFFDFTLSGPAPCEGFVVQQVVLEELVVECDKDTSCETALKKKKRKPTKWKPFWEAWHVDNGGTRRSDPGARRIKVLGLDYTDRAAAPPKPKTCGWRTATGYVGFFCKDGAGGTGDLGGLDREPAAGSAGAAGGWHVDPQSHAGHLPHTHTKPTWFDFTAWGGRYVSSWWNCCPCDKMTNELLAGEIKKEKP